MNGAVFREAVVDGGGLGPKMRMILDCTYKTAKIIWGDADLILTMVLLE